jgi:hypothetical protein
MGHRENRRLALACPHGEVDRPDLSRPERVELSSERCAAVEILDSERTI